MLTNLFVEDEKEPGTWHYDEYRCYKALKFMSIYECNDKLDGDPYYGKSHTVNLQEIHLPGEEPVRYIEGEESKVARHLHRLRQSGHPMSQLTAYFAACRNYPEATQNVTYLQMNNAFRYMPSEFEWRMRERAQKKDEDCIAMMYDIRNIPI